MIIIKINSADVKQPVEFGRIVATDTWGASVIQAHLQRAGLRTEVISNHPIAPDGPNAGVVYGNMDGTDDCGFDQDEQGDVAEGFAQGFHAATGLSVDLVDRHVVTEDDEFNEIAIVLTEV